MLLRSQLASVAVKAVINVAGSTWALIKPPALRIRWKCDYLDSPQSLSLRWDARVYPSFDYKSYYEVIRSKIRPLYGVWYGIVLVYLRTKLGFH